MVAFVHDRGYACPEKRRQRKGKEENMLVPVEQAGTHRTGTGGARRGMSAAASITVRVPLAIRRRLGWRTVVTPAQEHVLVMATRADPALAWAFRYQKLLDEGRYASISEMRRSGLSGGTSDRRWG